MVLSISITRRRHLFICNKQDIRGKYQFTKLIWKYRGKGFYFDLSVPDFFSIFGIIYFFVSFSIGISTSIFCVFISCLNLIAFHVQTNGL